MARIDSHGVRVLTHRAGGVAKYLLPLIVAGFVAILQVRRSWLPLAAVMAGYLAGKTASD